MMLVVNLRQDFSVNRLCGKSDPSSEQLELTKTGVAAPGDFFTLITSK